MTIVMTSMTIFHSEEYPNEPVFVHRLLNTNRYGREIIMNNNNQAVLNVSLMVAGNRFDVNIENEDDKFLLQNIFDKVIQKAAKGIEDKEKCCSNCGKVHD